MRKTLHWNFILQYLKSVYLVEEFIIGKVKSAWAIVAQTAGALGPYPCFCSIPHPPTAPNPPTLLSTGWDASPS